MSISALLVLSNLALSISFNSCRRLRCVLIVSGFTFSLFLNSITPYLPLLFRVFKISKSNSDIRLSALSFLAIININKRDIKSYRKQQVIITNNLFKLTFGFNNMSKQANKLFKEFTKNGTLDDKREYDEEDIRSAYPHLKKKDAKLLSLKIKKWSLSKKNDKTNKNLKLKPLNSIRIARAK